MEKPQWVLGTLDDLLLVLTVVQPLSGSQGLGVSPPMPHDGRLCAVPHQYITSCCTHLLRRHGVLVLWPRTWRTIEALLHIDRCGD